MVDKNEEKDIEILMILPGGLEEDDAGKSYGKLKGHMKQFRNWGEVSVFGPEGLYEEDDLYSRKNREYKGNASKSDIIEKIKSMKSADRVIYIDEGRKKSDKGWKFGSSEGDEDVLTYKEIDKLLGGNRAHIIIRGSRSGKALTNKYLAKPNRNIYCSMHYMEDGESDDFDLSSAVDPKDMHRNFEIQAKHARKNKGQTPQKWIGIRE